MSEQTHLASRDQLLSPTPKRRYREETLPVSGLKIRIQSLTERERSEFERSNLGKNGQANVAKLETIRRRLAILCLVDQAGNRLLNADDVGNLANWDSADMEALSDACAAHLGMKPEDLESIAKNSDRIAAAASPSA